MISLCWDSSQFENTGIFKNYDTDKNNTDNVKKTYEKISIFFSSQMNSICINYLH